jgi:F-type H+-transporting ATPase subunit epsilon
MAVPGSGRTFRLSVISPESSLFEGPAQFVVVPAFDGEIGILHDHAPLMALLGSGTLRIETQSEGRRTFYVAGGFVQVVDNDVSVLSEEAREVGIDS